MTFRGGIWLAGVMALGCGKIPHLIMQQLGISEVLASDHHFEQMGYVVLLNNP